MEIKNFKPRGLKIQEDEKLLLISHDHSWCNKCKSVKHIDEFGKDRSNRYGIYPICKLCKRDYARIRREEHPERVRKQRRESRKRRNDYFNEYRRNYYRTHPEARMQDRCRKLIGRALEYVKLNKPDHTVKLLGYTGKDLMIHIESQFKEGMSWDNYGKWHIDHIIPISAAKTLEDALLLSQLDNLQPLWSHENLSKSNRF